MKLTWLVQILICWGTASLIAAVLWHVIAGEHEDIEEEMRVDVLEELREHAWLN